MIEHASLCTQFKYHKLKLVFFLSAMRHYRDDLKKNGYSVTYLQLNDSNQAPTYWDSLYPIISKSTHLIRFEIDDHSFEAQINHQCATAGIHQQIHQSPMFISSRAEWNDYLNATKKPFMKVYYEAQRKNHGILVDANRQPIGGKWSFDSENRKKTPKNIVLPSRHFQEMTAHIHAVSDEVNHRFSDHIGDTKPLWVPVTRQGALNWWAHFKTHVFHQFGDYEDAIDTRDPFLFHSALSPLLNCGLLTPKEIIDDCTALVGTIPIHSLEGFIRQILGWREFIRGIYHTFDATQHQRNFWNHTRRLTHHWYHGHTGHTPLDDAIKTTIKWGYAHHIQRLMIIGSTMLCCNIHPQESYRWFMTGYIDSSDWVMGPNVFGMSQFSDGGIFATKPYICGSNYIRKMSHYGTGDWCDIADGLYWRFIHQQQAFFSQNPRMSLSVNLLNKMDGEKKSRLFRAAETFIQTVTSE